MLATETDKTLCRGYLKSIVHRHNIGNLSPATSKTRQFPGSLKLISNTYTHPKQLSKEVILIYFNLFRLCRKN